MPYYSFLLLCYNNWAYSQQAISSLVTSLPYKNNEFQQKSAELIVVDNGSTDETAKGMQELIAGFANKAIELRYHRLEENMGPIIGMNIGLALCRGEIIAYLNNDLIFPKGWFDALADVLEKDKMVGAAVPHLPNGGNVQNVPITCSSVKEVDEFGQNFMMSHKNKVVYTNKAVSSCLVFKREVLNKIGGNDFWYGLGLYDDDDWCNRCAIAGFKIAVVGGSFVYHLVSLTLNQDSQQFYTTHGQNRIKYFKKWDVQDHCHPNGFYPSEDNLIENSSYLRERDFFPIKIEDFNPSPVLYTWDDQIKRSLFVCDWSNGYSKWAQKLACSLDCLQSNEEIYLWIPNQYFLLDPIVSQVEKVLESKKLGSLASYPFVKIIHADIPPVDLIRLLCSFDAVVSTENDYVNRYIIYLAKQISVSIT